MAKRVQKVTNVTHFTNKAIGQTGQVSGQSEYDALSLRDLLDARDQYHIHLMRHPMVVATAVGYYRIRRDNSWPGVEPVVTGD